MPYPIRPRITHPQAHALILAALTVADEHDAAGRKGDAAILHRAVLAIVAAFQAQEARRAALDTSQNLPTGTYGRFVTRVLDRFASRGR